MPTWLHHCCPELRPGEGPPVPWPASVAAAAARLYTYDSGRRPGAGHGGRASYASGPQRIEVGPLARSVAFGGVVEGLAAMVPVDGPPVSAAAVPPYTSAAAWLPAAAVLVPGNAGRFGVTVGVRDTAGRWATIVAGHADPDGGPLVAAGFNVCRVGRPLPLALLRALGMADAGGSVAFRWALVPARMGGIAIVGAVVT